VCPNSATRVSSVNNANSADLKMSKLMAPVRRWEEKQKERKADLETKYGKNYTLARQLLFSPFSLFFFVVRMMGLLSFFY
jgi:hypothetical protein